MRIVVTGGACSGKTSLVEELAAWLRQLGGVVRRVEVRAPGGDGEGAAALQADHQDRRRRVVDAQGARFAFAGQDIDQRIIAAELLTPIDIENEFGITGGHWHHGELVLDQFLFVRPICGFAQYSMPVDGLFLCGAGAHPGGGVSGAPGRNAANEILAREKPG